MEIRKYMENPLRYMDLYKKHIKMYRKLLGNIQPMCSAPGHSWQGPFFSQKSAPFHKKCLFGCFLNKKTSLFIIKKARPKAADPRLRKEPAKPGQTSSGQTYNWCHMSHEPLLLP